MIISPLTSICVLGQRNVGDVIGDAMLTEDEVYYLSTEDGQFYLQLEEQLN